MGTNRLSGLNPNLNDLLNLPGFVPVKDRNYLTFASTDQELKEILEDKLNIPSQIAELKTKAGQRWAQVPWEKTSNSCTIRIFDCKQVYIGIMFLVSAEGGIDDNGDQYVVGLCPTKKDAEDFDLDFNDIAKEAGFKQQVWKN
jgi:hypothetical protein